MTMSWLNGNYVPVIDKTLTIKKLTKIPLKSLCELVRKWFTDFGSSDKISKVELENWLKEFEEFKTGRLVLSKYVMKHMYPKGLNLSQYAQLDITLMHHRPMLYSWRSSTAWDSSQRKHFIRIKPAHFVDNLRHDLQKIALSHIHISEHPSLPLIMCRIQLFNHPSPSYLTEYDQNLRFEDGNRYNNRQSSPPQYPASQIPFDGILEGHLISRTPYFVAFPLNSPTLIHSPDDDIFSQTILQSIQKSISEIRPVLLKLDDEKIVHSLESMHILNGPSRLTKSLGQWLPYVDSSFETSPLGEIKLHNAYLEENEKSKIMLLNKDSQQDNFKRKKTLELGKLKFTGSKDGRVVKSVYEKRYNKSEKIQKKNLNNYKSIIPTKNATFNITNTLKSSGTDVKMKFTLTGTDVFAGIHELCDKEMVDINNISGWMTGENGIYSGHIINGDFQRDYKLTETKGGLI